MKKEMEIYKKLTKEIEKINKTEYDKNDKRMVGYMEGLLTGFWDARSIVLQTFKEYCRFEDCDEENCNTCTKYDSM